MSDLQETILQLRKTLTKEISGFLVLFGERIDSESPQQYGVAEPVFGNFADETRTIYIENDLPSIAEKLTTNRLERIIGSNLNPEGLIGADYTWMRSEEIKLDDLILIHGALERKLNIILHREKE